ncbi:hypothetical protein QBC46DRAFT_438683 [Diplogelasinospora grovesii]|uniref:Terpene synthase n=1 Tax=Diplogelasinospora grovesii TaxID=303347 RepID=A0AAN6N4H9_9PEZI|nr:hypothetical protein QBC46DRAFT_438683 [Diplogelasinospora grovesii]
MAEPPSPRTYFNNDGPCGSKSSKSVPQTNFDPHYNFAREIKWKIIHVPSLVAIMAGWPRPDNLQHLGRLRSAINVLVELYVRDPDKCEKTKNYDLASYDTMIFPQTDDYDILYTASLLTLWLCLWEDYIDGNEDLVNDYEGAGALRARGLVHVRYCLGLGEVEQVVFPNPMGPMVVFEEFGKGAVARLSKREADQSRRLGGFIPIPEDYMEGRIVLTAVFPVFHTLNLFLDAPLPSWIMESPLMADVWKDVSFLVAAATDIMSLKKEPHRDCTMNIVPLLQRSGIGWDDIIPRLVDDMTICRKRIDDTADRFLQLAADDELTRRRLQKYIEGIKSICLGSIANLYHTKRYGLDLSGREDETCNIPL